MSQDDFDPLGVLHDWTQGLDDEVREARRDELQRAWGQLLFTKEGRLVLSDLRLTCRPEQSPLQFKGQGTGVDVERTMVSIGHREVWLQILFRLGLTYEQFLEKIVVPEPKEQTP